MCWFKFFLFMEITFPKTIVIFLSTLYLLTIILKKCSKITRIWSKWKVWKPWSLGEGAGARRRRRPGRRRRRGASAWLFSAFYCSFTHGDSAAIVLLFSLFNAQFTHFVLIVVSTVYYFSENVWISQVIDFVSDYLIKHSSHINTIWVGMYVFWLRL